MVLAKYSCINKLKVVCVLLILVYDAVYFFNQEELCDHFFKDLFIFRWEGREKEKERNISLWLPLMCPPQWTWPAIQACALTGN